MREIRKEMYKQSQRRGRGEGTTQEGADRIYLYLKRLEGTLGSFWSFSFFLLLLLLLTLDSYFSLLVKETGITFVTKR